MRLPNFFVLGAAKAGTTALANALDQHPAIFMSPLKEPFYFALDGEPHFPDIAGRGIKHRMVWRSKDYAALFSGVTNERAIGEASPLYLRSPLAARRIKTNLPDSKLIAILRQPADRAYSHYHYMVMHNVENAQTFAAALAEEDAGRREGWFSGACYRMCGLYHEQLFVYFDLFPKEQIRVYLYEDWKLRPQIMLRDLFGFLDVDENFVPDNRQINVTRAPGSRRLHFLAQRAGQQAGARPPGENSSLRSAIVRGLNWFDRTYNLKSLAPLDPVARHRLTEEYRADILKLQDLIERDLSSWLA